MKRKICVVTGSRADYGLLKLIMKGIDSEPNLNLQIIVTGMHLAPKFGLTYQEIEEDGFEIDYKIECLSSSDSPIAISEAMSKTLLGCAKAFEVLEPDIVIILGDRFEIFAAAAAALIFKIPIAHIHGGESTVGAYDEAFRHSITKMAQIHFVANEEYAKRVIQLGENPNRVFMVGGVAIDEINQLKILEGKDLEKILGIKFNGKSLLVTFHPSTLESEPLDVQMGALLTALADRNDTTLIFTMPNADTGGLIMTKMIEDFVACNKNAYAFKSLGRRVYLSCIANVDGVIGNSSSGILEAPSFKVGTINIGKRQQGRVMAGSVINCEANVHAITAAISELYSDEFKSKLQLIESPYGSGGACRKIVQIITEVSLDNIVQKSFYDLY